MNTYIPLSVHSEYSLVDSTLRIKDYVAFAAQEKIPALALTDIMNLFGAVKFHGACMQAGIQPIFGAELHILVQRDNQPHIFRMIALCQNQTGYHNLSCLLSDAYNTRKVDAPLAIPLTALTVEKCQGLIMLCGGYFGPIYHALLHGDRETLHKELTFWMQLFPERFYLELQRLESKTPIDEQALLQLSCEYACPVVASHPLRFLQKDDYHAHEARVAIARGETLDDPRRVHEAMPSQYCHSVANFWQTYGNVPAAIHNGIDLARRCTFEPELGKVYLPDFPTPNQETTETYFEHTAMEGLNKRFEAGLIIDDANKRKQYTERLAREIAVIAKMGFCGYFLIVADFIRFAKEHHIPVGPGRGSGAGSLVAYALDITDIDPIPYDLLFERFLNPERVSMPDFDIDFCMEGRDRVIHYVAERYGQEAVSQIITFGTMAAKAVVRDCGRVLSFSYGFVDKIAKLIPFEIGMTLQKALQDEPLLAQRYAEDEDVKQVIDLALKLEGLVRNVGKHAGGVVIAPKAITHFTPIYREPEGAQSVSQLDKDDIEAIGLVKFDFLGLRTLTIIHEACLAVARGDAQPAQSITLSAIPLNDAATFQLLQQQKTSAVFQLESRGMKELIGRLQPDCFEDIIALVALFRPGPLQSGMVDDFIYRKHGKAVVEYPHPALEPILKPTYGVILYQEQVMQIAQVLAGYSLGAADLLRRAMGKKKAEEMAKQRSFFLEGAQNNGISEEVAGPIFDLMEKFAGYGFNKSHSAAYALVSYQTAWLKTHFPTEFMAAVLSSEMHHTDKVVFMVQEARAMGMVVRPPHVNHGAYRFRALKNNEIAYGLGAIKGAGEAVIESLVDYVTEQGSFHHFLDCIAHIRSQKKANRRQIEALIKAGALDGLGPHRAAMIAHIDKALLLADRKQQAQYDLFADTLETLVWEEVPAWSEMQRLAYEKEALGMYFSGHPLCFYANFFEKGQYTPLQHLHAKSAHLPVMAYLAQMKIVSTKKDQKMATIVVEDHEGKQEDWAIFPALFEQKRSILEKGGIYFFKGKFEKSRRSAADEWRIHDILSPDEYLQASNIPLCFCFDEQQNLQAILQELKARQAETGVSLRLEVKTTEKIFYYRLPGYFHIDIPFLERQTQANISYYWLTTEKIKQVQNHV